MDNQIVALRSHDAAVAAHRQLATLPPEAPPRGWAAALLTRRHALILGAVGLAGLSLWLGWPWLAAAGIAPLVVALAPCAVMCAVGLCVMRAGPGNRAEAAARPNGQPLTIEGEARPLAAAIGCAHCAEPATVGAPDRRRS